MTTNVDIFFKDLSANTAVDRKERYNPSAEKTRATDNSNGTSLSEANNKDKKTFAEHLNEQTNNDHNVKNNAKSNTDKAAKPENDNVSAGSSSEQDTHTDNENVTLLNGAIQNAVQENNAAVETQSVNANSSNISDENVDQSNKQTDTAVSESEDIVSEAALSANSETAFKEKNANVYDNVSHSNDDVKGNIPTLPLNEDSQSSNITSATNNTYNDNGAGNQTPENRKSVDESNIVSNEVKPTSQQATGDQKSLGIEKDSVHNQKDVAINNEELLAEQTVETNVITLSTSKDSDSLLGKNNVTAEQPTDENMVPATVAQNNIQTGKEATIEDKANQKTLNSQSDNASITNRQDQNNSQNASSHHKNDDGKNNAANSNNNGAKDTTVIANNSSSAAQQTNIQNIIKSDITFDSTLMAQKTDGLLLQTTSINGQPSFASGSILTAQDINVHKSFTDLATLMRPQEALNAKMMNDQVMIAISQNALKGQNNFNIRLNPAELGQIDVKLEFMADGKVHASMMVESEKTLAMLQRDQAFLGRALQDSGLNLSQNSLNFSLMKQNSQGNGQNFTYSNNAPASDVEAENFINAANMQNIKMHYSNQAIDISV